MIAVCCALPQELNPLISCANIRKKFHFEKSIFYQADLKGRPVIFVQTGIGRENAVKATTHLLQTINITIVISSGVAGGIREGIHVGDLIFAENVHYCRQGDFGGERLPVESAFTVKGELVQLALELSDRLGVKYHCGDVLTVDKVIARAETKRKIGRQDSFIAVDMESAAIAQIARDKDIDFVIIRSVSDDVDDDLAIDTDNLITDTGKVRISNLAVNIMRDPKQLANLRRLNKQTKKAARCLSAFMREYIPLLYEKKIVDC
ncbi:MAG: 5'-methylthioadenosine/S-adenosylhomocysteine nucleosidase [Candidatus Scalindua sp.]|nr:5'-methylthioadenosine/S-adenosylhomocysteine nucleosidase [Candidatus Scalindua sp.]